MTLRFLTKAEKEKKIQAAVLDFLKQRKYCINMEQENLTESETEYEYWSAPYPERKDSQGNIIPFILPPYAKLKEQIYSTTKIKQQEQQRQIWQEEIDHLFNRNDVRLLWNIKKENYIHNQKNYPQTLSSSSSSSSSSSILSSSDSVAILLSLQQSPMPISSLQSQSQSSTIPQQILQTQLTSSSSSNSIATLLSLQQSSMPISSLESQSSTTPQQILQTQLTSSTLSSHLIRNKKKRKPVFFRQLK